MSKYDEIFESIQADLLDGKITFEEAQCVNNIACQKYNNGNLRPIKISEDDNAAKDAGKGEVSEVKSVENQETKKTGSEGDAKKEAKKIDNAKSTTESRLDAIEETCQTILNCLTENARKDDIDSDEEEQETKESVDDDEIAANASVIATRLNIYESYQNGAISEEEKNELLSLL